MMLLLLPLLALSSVAVEMTAAQRSRESACVEALAKALQLVSRDVDQLANDMQAEHDPSEHTWRILSSATPPIPASERCAAQKLALAFYEKTFRAAHLSVAPSESLDAVQDALMNVHAKLGSDECNKKCSLRGSPGSRAMESLRQRINNAAVKILDPVELRVALTDIRSLIYLTRHAHSKRGKKRHTSRRRSGAINNAWPRRRE
ncbi:uncharacterized protein LOC133349336 [Lethenteron reissneri]|uniref:uncharacterized protein LOC133349336 n=1 Tax=Lethenteron reissneri TaxID=7753 RepID=UPI002AB6EF73|nr:uncharacterized protein LOC133349336 [Lethenteron reissneri]